MYKLTAIILLVGCGSTFGTPEMVAGGVYKTVLKAQGSSPEKFLNIISSNSDSDNLIQKVNYELNSKLLERNDNSIKFNINGLKDVIGNTVQFSVASLTKDSNLGKLARPQFDKRLNALTQDLQNWIDQNPISIDSLNTKGLRSLDVQPRFLDAIINPIGGLLQIITGPINWLIKWALQGLITNLECALGGLIMSPIRALLNYVIDSALPCATCVEL